MGAHERLTRHYERVTAIRGEERTAQRMQYLQSARKVIGNLDLCDGYDVSVHEVVLVAAFLAGDDFNG